MENYFDNEVCNKCGEEIHSERNELIEGCGMDLVEHCGCGFRVVEEKAPLAYRKLSEDEVEIFGNMKTLTTPGQVIGHIHSIRTINYCSR